jgi:NTP pyrophosphatase (non-canonical NTP hydrolase)
MMFDEHRAKIESLEMELEATRKRHAEETQELMEKVKQREGQINNFKTMILRSGRKDDGLNDSEITDGFTKLKSDIISFCKTHLPAGPKVRSNHGASPDISELLVRAKVADELYWCFFDSVNRLFGYQDCGQVRTTSKSLPDKSPFQYLECHFTERLNGSNGKKGDDDII